MAVRLPTADDIQQVGIARDPGVRAGPDDFGAQIGRAEQMAGQAIQNVAQIGHQLAQKRQEAEDKVFLDTFDLEYSKQANETYLNAQEQAPLGGEGFTETVGAGLAQDADSVTERLMRERGFHPSQRALRAAQSLALNRRANVAIKAQTWEHNQRIAALGSQFDETAATLGQEAFSSGDPEAALARLYDSAKAYEGIIPAAALDEKLKAAEEAIAQNAIAGLFAAGRADEALALSEKYFGSRPRSATAPVDQVVDRIIGVESGGSAVAKNPNSSATGAGQFIASTWLAMINKYRPDLAKGRSADDVLALRNDPALSREMVRHYAEENASFLHNQGLQTTPGNLYLAHFLGPRGAAQVLKAEPDTPIGSIVGQDAVDANPFLKGKSASQVAAWADDKMGEAARDAEPPVFPNAKLALANYDAYARFGKQKSVSLKAGIDIAEANAPVAIQNTGSYDGELPTLESYVTAYGEETGRQRYAAFAADIQASHQAYEFQTMSTDDIRATVAAARPSSSGDLAQAEQERFDTLSKAADSAITAREKDPSTYVMRAFPEVAQAWRDAGQSGDYAHALSLTSAAQTQLGIDKPQLLPAAVAQDAVSAFKDDEKSDEERLAAISSLIFTTTDPEQRRTIFNQMVEAGLPAMAEGAMEAISRGDMGAARRLMRAVLVDPKDLPKDSTVTPAMISDTIYSNVWADGEVGNVAYGLSYGSAASLGRAQRATDLMKRAVQLRMARGEDLDTAIDGAKSDLFGDVIVYDGSGDINAEMTVPAGTDMDVLTKGLRAAKEEFAFALVDQRDRLLTRGGGEAADGTKAILDATTQNRMNDVLESGEFVQIGDGIGLRDPYTGGFVTDVDGVTPLVIPLDTILQKGQGATRGSMSFDPRKSRRAFDAGMSQIEGWTGQ